MSWVLGVMGVVLGVLVLPLTMLVAPSWVVDLWIGLWLVALLVGFRRGLVLLHRNR